MGIPISIATFGFSVQESEGLVRIAATIFGESNVSVSSANLCCDLTQIMPDGTVTSARAIIVQYETRHAHQLLRRLMASAQQIIGQDTQLVFLRMRERGAE